jgi:glutathione peroxidase
VRGWLTRRGSTPRPPRPSTPRPAPGRSRRRRRRRGRAGRPARAPGRSSATALWRGGRRRSSTSPRSQFCAPSAGASSWAGRRPRRACWAGRTCCRENKNTPTDWKTGSNSTGSLFTVVDTTNLARPLIPAPAAVRNGATGALRRSALVLVSSLVAAAPAVAADACPAILNHRFQSLQDQKPQSLCQWQGKVVLVVNTASHCGFTSQYDGLEKLYAGLKDQGDWSLSDFRPMTSAIRNPAATSEIAEFCRLTYGVKFPMFAKTTVSRQASQPASTRKLAKATGTEPRSGIFTST